MTYFHHRLDIIKIHAGGITKRGEIDYDSVAKLADGFNGADLRNICTEAGLFAIREDRDYVLEEDFMKVCVLRGLDVICV
jgi:26S proteasome regulatory subunit T4